MQHNNGGGGNGDTHQRQNKGGGPRKKSDGHVSGKLVIKPRPTPRGYKPPLDAWKGIKMQPAAINSLQSAGQLGRKIAGHAISSYRSYASQVPLWHRYQAGGFKAAPPGSSYHQQGLAIDDPWIRAHHAAMQWMLHHGWNSGASFGDPNHWTYKVTG